MAQPQQVTASAPTSSLARFRGFLREVRGEARKVTWPTREQLKDSTIVVLVTVLIISSLIAIIDRIIGVLVSALMGLVV